jgi:putative membrane protein
MNQIVSLFLKGLAMGAANVIPGVSGGTIALITGIYERLINAIKSVDHNALKLVLQLRFADFWRTVDGTFLASLFAGIAVSIVSLAKLLEFLLEHYETHTMAFFFGLILLSIVFVGKTVEKWNFSSILMLLIGTAIAVSVALLAPASEDNSFFYVFLCGIVAICSMILPGLSGSFILIIMGNYALILAAISHADFSILVPLALGCGFGLIAFSHLLAWIFKHFRDQTIAMMTGFILGSLAIIWPWKTANIEIIARQNKSDKELVTGYDWALPALTDSTTWQALLLVAIGAVTIWGVEKFAGDKPTGELATK